MRSNRNGNINWDVGHERMCQFIANTLNDPDTSDSPELERIRASVSAILDCENPDTSGHQGPHYYLTELAVRWCLWHPEPIPHVPNPTLKR